jgi:tyrosinase
MPVRQDIWTLGEEDPIISWYRYAVGVLKERGAEDVTSWTYQAAMHGSAEGAAHPAWNNCQHGSWYFLPWHRMYVFRMEEILRAAIVAAEGPEDWALPYWNYGLGGEFATLPPAFRAAEVENEEGELEPNSLYTAERAEGINGGLELPPAAITAALALARPAFVGAAECGGGAVGPAKQAGEKGRLERLPHDAVHVNVGGWMRSTNTAALDPCFWIHHANIDRLWHVWRQTEGHTDPEQAEWLGQEFPLFNAAGEAVTTKCEDVADTAALGYEYGPEAPPPIAPFEPGTAVAAVFPGGEGVTSPELIGATSEPITLVGEQVDVEVPIDAEAAGELASGQRVYLNIENIEGEEAPATSYGVYVDVASDESGEGLDSHLVDTLSFFGIERSEDPGSDQHPHGFRSAIEISGIAQEMSERGEWGGASLRVSLRPLLLQAPTAELESLIPDPAHPETPITIGRISVFYDA